MSHFVNTRDISALAWAVEQAAVWRGLHTGDDDAVAAFDKKVAAARDALKKLRAMNRSRTVIGVNRT